MSTVRHAVQQAAEKVSATEKQAETWRARAEAVIALYDPLTNRGCTEKQRALILDPAKNKAGRSPRRSGKSHGVTAYALYTGERDPGRRVLIIGLTLKSAKENFWVTAPGGLQSVAGRFELGIAFNSQDMSWRHENGSIGYLAGAETAADLERLRGSKVEADLVVVDECKSFSPDLLHQLVTDILTPGLMTRDGTLLLIGTPGSIPVGPFYEATCEASRTQEPDSRPTCLPYHEDRSGFTPEELEDLWSLHIWTLQDNAAKPKQWQRALREKRRNGWDDNHPTWKREFMGEWVVSAKELVYHQYVEGLKDHRVNWRPNPETKEPHGLPAGGGPWHYVAGLDWGYEDPTGLVIAAYGELDSNLYVVDEHKEEHMTYDEVKRLLTAKMTKYPLDVIIYDRAGKQLGESLAGDGYPAFPADRHEKFDFIELLNSDFASGRVKILRGSELHNELTGLQFDLSKGKKDTLAHLGRLKEDPRCPNHLTDALLYLWRWSQHGIGSTKPAVVERGSAEWWRDLEAAQKRAAEEAWIRTKEHGRLGTHGKTDHALTRERIYS